jgi:hypothetical protein
MPPEATMELMTLWRTKSLLSRLVALAPGAEDTWAHIYRRSHVYMESTAFHCLVPNDLIDRPSIVHRSEESAVARTPFLGKGLDQALNDARVVEHIEMFEWDDFDDVVEKERVRSGKRLVV